jgi:hypothetical protein
MTSSSGFNPQVAQKRVAGGSNSLRPNETGKIGAVVAPKT